MGTTHRTPTRRSAQSKRCRRSSTCPASDQSPEPTAPTSPTYPKGRVPSDNYNTSKSDEPGPPPHYWSTPAEREAFLETYDVEIPAMLEDGWMECFSPSTLGYLQCLEEEDIQTDVEVEETELFCTCFGTDDGTAMVECANEDDCAMRWFHIRCLSKDARNRGLAKQGTASNASLHNIRNHQITKRAGQTLADGGRSLDTWFCDRCIEREIGLLSEQSPISALKVQKRKKTDDHCELQSSKRRKSSGTKTQSTKTQPTSRRTSKETKKRALAPPKLSLKSRALRSKPAETVRASIEIPKASPIEFSLTAPLQPTILYHPVSYSSTSPESFEPLALRRTPRTAVSASFPQFTPAQSTISPTTSATPQLSRGRSWAAHEEVLLTGVIRELSKSEIAGRDLWETASTRMQQHGVDRSPAAAKAVWSRELRERSGIDERKFGTGGPMRTSLQKRKGDGVGRERRGSV